LRYIDIDIDIDIYIRRFKSLFAPRGLISCLSCPVGQLTSFKSLYKSD